MNRLGVIVAPFFLLGCVAQNDARLQKVAELNAEIATLQIQAKSLEEQIGSLQGDVSTLQLQAEPYKTAVFDPGSPASYQRIDTDGGTFLVSILNVTPYVDGFRVTCNFGNPSSATFSGSSSRQSGGHGLTS